MKCSVQPTILRLDINKDNMQDDVLRGELFCGVQQLRFVSRVFFGGNNGRIRQVLPWLAVGETMLPTCIAHMCALTSPHMVQRWVRWL
jgi:hypothetical protein